MNLEKVQERLDAIVSERKKTFDTRVEAILTTEKLTDSLVDLKRHRQDEAAKEFNKQVFSKSPAGVVDRVLTLKAVQPKVQQLEDNIAKMDGIISEADKQIRKLDSEKQGLLKKHDHLVNLQRLQTAVTNILAIAPAYNKVEMLYSEAQKAVIEMKSEGFKIPAGLKELEIQDPFIEQVLGCRWLQNSNFPEALQQLCRPNLTEKPEDNPFFDFSGKKRIVRANNLSHDFKASHTGQGFSFTGAEINAARDHAYRQFNQ